MANYLLVSPRKVETKYQQYLYTSTLPNGFHILPISALRFMDEEDVRIVNEAEIRAMRGNNNSNSTN